MVKKIYLLRHAETFQLTGNQKDIDRELTATGFRDAVLIGKFMAGKSWIPDAIYSSSAQRANDTTHLVAEQLNYSSSKINYMEELYQATTRVLINIINQFNEEEDAVLVVGHNPHLSYLVELLTGEEIGALDPGGLVKLTAETDQWPSISSGTCSLSEVIFPVVLRGQG